MGGLSAKQHPGGSQLLYNRSAPEICLEVVVRDKRALDELIMSTIQMKWAVTSTRTLLVIDNLVWKSGQGLSGKPVFLSLAEPDLAFGVELAKRIEQDTGLDTWTYKILRWQSQAVGIQLWTRR